jgi:hypothetical protein
MAPWRGGDHEEISDDPAPWHTARASAHPSQRGGEKPGRGELRPYVAQTLLSEGRFRVSADTPEMVELFQRVARRVGDMLRRSVVSYANGREIVIIFGQEEAHGLTGQSARSIQE